jgi:hypothetical protein
MAGLETKGKCEACGKSPRILTQIESGQFLCRTCLRELRPPRPKNLAREMDIAHLQSKGFKVGDDLDKEECRRLLLVDELRDQGEKIPDDAPLDLLNRIATNIRHRNYGGPIRYFHTNIAGVTHDNNDGTSRQRIIKRCQQLEPLLLDHEENNPFDSNAVKVCNRRGEHIGYLHSELAGEIVANSSEGYRYAAFVKDITGGTADRPTYGMNLLIIVAEPGIADDTVQRYVDENRHQLLQD